MSDCVFDSFKQHVEYLGLEVQDWAKDLFYALRKPTLPDATEDVRPVRWDAKQRKYVELRETPKEVEDTKSWGWYDRVWAGSGYSGLRTWDFSYTHGTVAPLIIHTLAMYHGLGVRAQYNEWYGQATLSQLAKTGTQVNILRRTKYLMGESVPEVTLSPAIYLMVDGWVSRHAIFKPHLPMFDVESISGAFQLYIPKEYHNDNK